MFSRPSSLALLADPVGNLLHREQKVVVRVGAFGVISSRSAVYATFLIADFCRSA